MTSERAKQISNLAVKSPRIGKRGPDKVTLTKEQAYREVQQKIIERSMKLTNAQTMLGLGTIKVFRIDAHYEMFGKVRKLVKDKPKIVKDDKEIISVLDHEYGDGEDPSDIENDLEKYPKFYFVETKDANNQAIDSQLNRLFGKATEKVDMTSNGRSIAPVIVGMRIIDNSKSAIPLEAESQKIIDVSPVEEAK